MEKISRIVSETVFRGSPIMTFVITTRTHTENPQVPLPYQGHRHGGGARPVAPEECRARHCTL